MALIDLLSSQLSFLMAVRIYKIHGFHRVFPYLYQKAYGQQAFQDDDMLQEAFTHKYAWNLSGVVSWA